MLIQPLLFPPSELIGEPELFFQGISTQNISDTSVSLSTGSELSLGTYFNAFSIGKWREYTGINNIFLKLSIVGRVEIKAYHAIGRVNNSLLAKGKGTFTEEEYIQKVNTQAYSATREEVECVVTHEGDVYTIKFNQLYSEGILYVTIKAISDAVLKGGGYETETDDSLLNPVNLAIGICTFKREDAICNNVKRIISEVISNPKSPLKDKLEVYIADNGQTLDINQFNNDKVHIFPNPNLGGVGGFTRTMIEALFHDKAKGFTHIILMDDDILLYTPVLERTFYLLQLLNDKYKKAILGAEMLLMENMYIHHAAGVLYKDGVAYIGRANHKFFDLRKPQAVAANEVINETNHTGWWYACIPREVAHQDNLPMPFFVHYDDVEYGVRNLHNREMYINGICVWHPSPLNKSPFWMIYYDTRNRLITMFSKPLARKNLFKYIIKNTRLFAFHITRYEYKRAQLIINGIQDFLSGPKEFIAQDALALHQRLLENKDSYVSPEESGISRETIINRSHRNLLIAGIEQLFCNLLPAKDTVLAINTRYFNVPYRAKKLYMYDDKQDKGYILERDQKAFFKLLFSYNMAILKLFWQYNHLLHDWQEVKPTLTGLPFWEKYLGLEHKE